MRFACVALLTLGMAACSGSTPVLQGGNASVPNRAVAGSPVIDPLAGVSAHYVVEMGANADRQLQVDIRQIQEPSIFASPQPFRSASIVYPDGTVQRVDSSGEFDAAESSYARGHGEKIGDRSVVVHVVSPIAIAFQPTSFSIYVPSKETERRESSVAAPVNATLADNPYPIECTSIAPHQSVEADDVALLTFTVSRFLGVSFPVELASCTTKIALGRVTDYLWISGSGKYRYTLRYEAPSRTALHARGVTAVGEYLGLPRIGASKVVRTLVSPRYDIACGKSGC